MQDERWLVKSSGRVLGPFSLDDLIQHLRARTLSVLDEIREPNTRWGFIRENALLREVVRQLRDEDDKHPEATQTTFVGGATSGRTVTLSATESSAQEGELTPNPSFYGNRSTDPKPIHATERNVSGGMAGQSYGSLQDQRVQKMLQDRKSFVRNLLVGVAILCVAVLAGLFYYERHAKELAIEQARQWVEIAHEQIRFGRTTKALEFMSKAAQEMPLSEEDRILHAELLLQVEGKSGEALRLLSEVRNLQDTRLLREMGLAKALVFMKDQRWNEATIELNSLLSFNPGDEEALHNQSLLEFYRGHISLSVQNLSLLFEKGYRNGQLLILKGFQAMNWPEKSGQTQRIQQAAEDLRRNLEGDFELHLEKGLMLINLYLQLGRTQDAAQALRNIWNADPFDSRNFLQPLNIDQQILSWDRLGPLCDRAVAALSKEETILGLRAICLYHKGETGQALQKMDEARRQLSQSPLIAAIQSDLLLNVGRMDEAKTLLQMAGDETLGLLVTGQICQDDKDWACSDTIWKKVLRVQPKNPMALFGEAFVTKQRGNDSLSREQIRKAIILSPRYRPLIEARGDSNVF